MIKLDTDQKICDYFAEMMSRVSNQAKKAINTNCCLLMLIRKHGDKIHAKEIEGKIKNMVWFSNRQTGRRYCLSYNPETGYIDVKDRSANGPVVAELNDAIEYSQLERIFDQMDNGII